LINIKNNINTFLIF